MDPSQEASAEAAAGGAAEPTYDTLFPGLGAPGSKPRAPWGKSAAPGAVRSKKTSTTVQIPHEEQKYSARAAIGAKGNRQAQIIHEIITETGAQIETSSSRDQTLSLIISGKPKAVAAAKESVMRQLVKPAEIKFDIPLEHHGMIIGKGGESLKRIQAESGGARIQLTRDSTEITVSGLGPSCRLAKEIIEEISRTEANRDRQKLEMLQAYHPLICGHKNETLNRIKSETGAQIFIPRSDRDEDFITVSGERTAVANAVAQLNAIYDERRRTCGELTAQVKKSQHKYVIGPKGVNIDEIMQRFCVVVEMPPADSESETIVLRGSNTQLVHALTCVYEKASSVVTDSIKLPAWLHKHIIGRKGANIKKMTADMPHTHIDFNKETGQISLEGPPEEVTAAKNMLTTAYTDLVQRMAFDDIAIDPKHYPQLIGRGGATIMAIKKSTETQIDFPDAAADGSSTGLIHIEGPPAGVASAKAQLITQAAKLENQRTLEMDIDQRFHSLIIGSKGAKIKALQAKCGDITIDFPKANSNVNTIIIRGDKIAVGIAELALKDQVAQLTEDNFLVNVSVFKQFHRNIIGKGGAVIGEIKKAHDVRIDVPAQDEDSDVIRVTGKKAAAEAARDKILAIQAEIADIATEEMAIDAKLHSRLRGKVAGSISEECGGVQIRFPKEGEAGPVVIKGPEKSVADAKKKLDAVAGDLAHGGESKEIKVAQAHHRHIIGRGGAAHKELQESSKTLILFPSKGKGGKGKAGEVDVVTIFGKKAGIAAATAAILGRVKELESIVEDTVDVEKQYHSSFFSRRGAAGSFLQQLSSDYGGVSLSMPKDGSTTIKLKGGEADVPKAIAKIKQFVDDIQSRVTLTCVIPAQHHRSIIGQGGKNLRKVIEAHNVEVKLPDRKSGKVSGGAAAAAAADGADAPPKPADIVKLSGRKEACEAAIEALKALVPSEEVLQIEPDFHRFIIGQKGVGIKKLMEDHDVFVRFPGSGSSDSSVKVRGVASAIESFKAALAPLLAELEQGKEERALRSFKVVLEIPPEHHQKLIGKGGAVITALREKHDVQVDFPDRRKKLSDEAAKKVIITGMQANAEAAGEEMAAKAKEYESLVRMNVEINPGCHRKIIGRGGDKIKELQKKFGVRIMLPRDGDDEYVIVLEGAEEACADCHIELQDIEEEWFQEEDEYGEEKQYVKPSRYDEEEKPKKAPAYNVPVPWEKPPSAKDTAAYPGLGGAAKSNAGAQGAWGVRR